MKYRPDDNECHGGECHKSQETGELVLCRYHDPNAEQPHPIDCVCIDCHYQPGDRITDND